MEEMSIEVVKDEKVIPGPETYTLPDFADNMFALQENDVTCELVSEVGLRTLDNNWIPLEEAMPHVQLGFSKDFKSYKIDNLQYTDVKELDENLIHSENCDKMLKLDWRVTAKQTIDKETYRSFSSEHDVFAKILFKETLCKEEGSSLAMVLACSLVIAIILITGSIVLLCRC